MSNKLNNIYVKINWLIWFGLNLCTFYPLKIASKFVNITISPIWSFNCKYAFKCCTISWKIVCVCANLNAMNLSKSQIWLKSTSLLLNGDTWRVKSSKMEWIYSEKHFHVSVATVVGEITMLEKHGGQSELSGVKANSLPNTA